MSDQIHVRPDQASADVILVDGVCYYRYGPSDQPPDSVVIAATFENCDQCNSSSSSSSSSESSGCICETCGDCSFSTCSTIDLSWSFGQPPEYATWDAATQASFDAISSGSVTAVYAGAPGQWSANFTDSGGNPAAAFITYRCTDGTQPGSANRWSFSVDQTFGSSIQQQVLMTCGDGSFVLGCTGGTYVNTGNAEFLLGAPLACDVSGSVTATLNNNDACD